MSNRPYMDRDHWINEALAANAAWDECEVGSADEHACKERVYNCLKQAEMEPR